MDMHADPPYKLVTRAPRPVPSKPPYRSPPVLMDVVAAIEALEDDVLRAKSFKALAAVQRTIDLYGCAWVPKLTTWWLDQEESPLMITMYYYHHVTDGVRRHHGAESTFSIAAMPPWIPGIGHLD